MYIDIFLAITFILSIYVLRQRISEKIPELTLVPDQDLSVLVEENTAKLQLFFLHLFHFRSFYRERHYHEKVRAVVAKLLLKFHIFLLRIDNGLMSLIKRVKNGNEVTIQQENNNLNYLDRAEGQRIVASPMAQAAQATHVVQTVQQSTLPEMSRMQEVRPRRRVGVARAPLRLRKAENTKIKLADDRTFPYSRDGIR